MEITPFTSGMCTRPVHSCEAQAINTQTVCTTLDQVPAITDGDWCCLGSRPAPAEDRVTCDKAQSFTGSACKSRRFLDRIRHVK